MATFLETTPLVTKKGLSYKSLISAAAFYEQIPIIITKSVNSATTSVVFRGPLSCCSKLKRVQDKRAVGLDLARLSATQRLNIQTRFVDKSPPLIRI